VQIALVLYPGFTALDIIGPFQVLADVPGHDVVFVAAAAGSVVDHTGRCPLIATASFAEVTSPDVVVVPGSIRDEPPQPELVDWLRDVSSRPTWTTSVCTGSLALAAGGLLDGVDATCHWARASRLEELGARYTEQRVVERGPVVTAAGVSAGIDMALTLLDRLHGRDVAEMVQLAIEYDPRPPFDAGSPSRAAADTVALVRAVLNPVADTIAG